MKDLDARSEKLGQHNAHLIDSTVSEVIETCLRGQAAENGENATPHSCTTFPALNCLSLPIGQTDFNLPILK